MSRVRKEWVHWTMDFSNISFVTSHSKVQIPEGVQQQVPVLPWLDLDQPRHLETYETKVERHA